MKTSWFILIRSSTHEQPWPQGIYVVNLFFKQSSCDPLAPLKALLAPRDVFLTLVNRLGYRPVLGFAVPTLGKIIFTSYRFQRSINLSWGSFWGSHSDRRCLCQPRPHTHTDRQTDRQAGRQAGRHAGRQTGRQIDRYRVWDFISKCVLTTCEFTIVFWVYIFLCVYMYMYK